MRSGQSYRGIGAALFRELQYSSLNSLNCRSLQLRSPAVAGFVAGFLAYNQRPGRFAASVACAFSDISPRPDLLQVSASGLCQGLLEADGFGGSHGALGRTKENDSGEVVRNFPSSGSKLSSGEGAVSVNTEIAFKRVGFVACSSHVECESGSGFGETVSPCLYTGCCTYPDRRVGIVNSRVEFLTKSEGDDQVGVADNVPRKPKVRFMPLLDLLECEFCFPGHGDEVRGSGPRVKRRSD